MKSEALEKETNYISPSKFSKDLADYYEAAIEAEKLDPNDKSPEARQKRIAAKKALDKCGISLYKIAVGLSNNGKFSGYTWKDEMICDALLKGNRALVRT